MSSLLSTKTLSIAQKELCLNAGIAVVDYNAIKVELLPVSVPNKIKNAIFTSKNGVLSIFSAENETHPKIENCYCVGPKTAQKLNENGQNVIEIAENASELASILAKNYQNEHFYYFCSNIRRNTLPESFKNTNNSLTEVISYKTHLLPKHFERTFDAIAFYSPSGVQSFMQENSLENTLASCIGTTTASEAKKHTSNIVIANSPTVTSTLVKAIKTLLHDRT